MSSPSQLELRPDELKLGVRYTGLKRQTGGGFRQKVDKHLPNDGNTSLARGSSLSSLC